MFELADSRAFYAMLVEDFDEFMTEQHSARRALHCAITAYHLYEWAWGDWLKRDHAVRKALGVGDRQSFLAWIKRACIWFPVIEGLANGTKHFARRQDFETALVMAAPIPPDVSPAVTSEDIWGGPIRYVQSSHPIGPHGQGYLLIDYGVEAGEHQFQPAAAVLEIAVRFWRDFFRAYRPDPELPASKHHPF